MKTKVREVTKRILNVGEEGILLSNGAEIRLLDCRGHSNPCANVGIRQPEGGDLLAITSDCRVGFPQLLEQPLKNGNTLRIGTVEIKMIDAGMESEIEITDS